MNVTAETTLSFTSSKEYAEFGPCYRDVRVPGVAAESFTVKTLSAQRLELTNLLIKFSEQGKGHGSKAVQTLIHWARSNGIRSIHLESLSDAVGFWEKQGFSKTATRASETDWVRMTLDLSVRN